MAMPRDLPHHRPATVTGARAGFGLIEAIVALAVAGLVLAAITEVAGRTLRSWSSGLGTVAAIERSDVALGRMARDLSGLLPIRLATGDDPTVLFAGDARGMAFMALTPVDRTEDGIAIVEIGIEPSGDGAVLTRRMRRARDAGLRDGDRVVLLSGRVDLAFSYRDKAGRRVDRWSRPGEVPKGVVVTLRGSRAEGGGLPVEVMLPIPVQVAVSCLIEAPNDDATDGAGRNAAGGAGRNAAGGAQAAAAATTDAAAQASAQEGRRKRCAAGPGAAAPAQPGEGGQ